MHSAASNTSLTTGKFLSSPVTKSCSKHLGLIGCLSDATRDPGSFLFFGLAFLYMWILSSSWLVVIATWPFYLQLIPTLHPGRRRQGWAQPHYVCLFLKTFPRGPTWQILLTIHVSYLDHVATPGCHRDFRRLSTFSWLAAIPIKSGVCKQG